MKCNFEAVLFDLDGTLADTAADLGAALNFLLEKDGHCPLPMEQIRPYVSGGSGALVQLGFGIDETHPRFKSLRGEFLDFYGNNLCVHSRLFDGIEELLLKLDERNIRWGIVTNKPHIYTEPLLSSLPLPSSPDCVVSGDTLMWKKPHPAPLLHACRVLGVNPRKSVFVGDDERDVLAGRRAGMHTIVALFGYIVTENNPDNWGADDLVEQSRDIHSIIFS